MSNGDDDYTGASVRSPFPLPRTQRVTIGDYDRIEEAPARKEAALMHEQGETAEDYREVAARKGFKTTSRPPGRQLTRRSWR